MTITYVYVFIIIYMYSFSYSILHSFFAHRLFFFKVTAFSYERSLRLQSRHTPMTARSISARSCRSYPCFRGQSRRGELAKEGPQLTDLTDMGAFPLRQATLSKLYAVHCSTGLFEACSMVSIRLSQLVSHKFT